MLTATVTFAAVLASGPAAPDLPLLAGVSQPTEVGVSLAPNAGPPVAAPVAGPPVAAPVAGPPAAAPPDVTPSSAPPGGAPSVTVRPPPPSLPTALGLSSALTEAREREQMQSALVDDSPTQTIVIKTRPGEYERYDDYDRYDDEAYEALYERDPGEFRISGYGGISVRGSTIMHNPAVWVGGRGGLLLGEHFSIGGAFYEVTYRHGGAIVDPAGNELGIRAAYGGLHLGYGMVNRDRFHLDLDTLIGAGKACISSRPGYKDDDWRCIESVRMFVTEPALSARFDVLEWFRLGLTAGYRFAARQAWRPPNDFQVSGPYVGLDFDFGWFE